MKKRVLLMYISKDSGHHCASRAIENALHELSDDVETLNVNSFHYTNPILEKIINKTYMSVIRRKPEIWGYLYDNPKVIRKTQRLRDAIHKNSSNKIKVLLEQFKPDAIVCTQAFPCGILADYKRTSASRVILSGVLTDYAPHAYWFHDEVDIYFVPSVETKEKLISGGISREKVELTGIPIDLKFRKIVDKGKAAQSFGISTDLPIVLIMGGSQGMGPIHDIIKVLDRSRTDFQIVVATGGNKKLHRTLKRRELRFKKKVTVLGYAENIEGLMQISSIVISKPGGITISEALAVGLPILIVKPIPGHEEMNTQHLTKHKVAIKIDNIQDVELYISELLSNPSSLKNMRERARAFSNPNSAFNIAENILNRIM